MPTPQDALTPPPIAVLAAAKADLARHEEAVHAVLQREQLAEERTLVYAAKEAIRVAKMLVGEVEQRMERRRGAGVQP